MIKPNNNLKHDHLTSPSNLVYFLFILLSLPLSSSLLKRTPPPLPILPIPTSSQLNWQLSELSLFLHFGLNTFTDSEWGSGSSDPSLFAPTHLDARQWVRVAKAAGFTRIVLTAKHHDGFCLWPTDYTDYSVRASGWRGGVGDVVAELAEAAKEEGVELGLYLSPWDRHDKCYGRTQEYNQFYLAQMSELLTRYEEIKEVFLDGAKGEGEKDMEYFFDVWFDVIHQLQPGAVIFSDAGPDVRWVGDEAGVAGYTCWSTFNRSAAKIGDTDRQYGREGDQMGHDWVPAECDVSIRPGWFWHDSEAPKSALTLLDIYYKSVGRNCHLLLNVPPNSSGLISEEDIHVLQEFSELRSLIFSNNMAMHAILTASTTRGGLNSPFDVSNVIEESIYTYWAPEENEADWILYIDFNDVMSFNVLQLQEPIQLGQRIMLFHVDILDHHGVWKKIVDGTTIGFKRLLQFRRVESQHLRLVIEKARANPLISFVGVHLDRYSTLSSIPDTREETTMSEGVTFFKTSRDMINPLTSFRKTVLRSRI